MTGHKLCDGLVPNLWLFFLPQLPLWSHEGGWTCHSRREIWHFGESQCQRYSLPRKVQFKWNSAMYSRKSLVSMIFSTLASLIVTQIWFKNSGRNRRRRSIKGCNVDSTENFDADVYALLLKKNYQFCENCPQLIKSLPLSIRKVITVKNKEFFYAFEGLAERICSLNVTWQLAIFNSTWKVIDSFTAFKKILNICTLTNICRVPNLSNKISRICRQPQQMAQYRALASVVFLWILFRPSSFVIRDRNIAHKSFRSQLLFYFSRNCHRNHTKPY